MYVITTLSVYSIIDDSEMYEQHKPFSVYSIIDDTEMYEQHKPFSVYGIIDDTEMYETQAVLCLQCHRLHRYV